MQLKYSREAQKDLEIIAYDGYLRFGAVRSSLYLKDIEETVKIVLSFPEIGKIPFPEEAPETRSIPSGMHLIFYEVAEDSILINAIIHGRANTEEIIASRRYLEIKNE